MTLIELVLSVAIAAIILAGLNSLIKLGVDAQATGQGTNDLAYQGQFALQRIANTAIKTAPKELTTPAASTTGDWFAPTGCVGTACIMYCRNTVNQLIETTTADTACASTTAPVIASNVITFSATPNAGSVDRALGMFTLTMSDNLNNALTLTASIRLGGGTL
jgi:type II secretory pathway pseudopilin PulG